MHRKWRLAFVVGGIATTTWDAVFAMWPYALASSLLMVAGISLTYWCEHLERKTEQERLPLLRELERRQRRRH